MAAMDWSRDHTNLWPLPWSCVVFNPVLMYVGSEHCCGMWEVHAIVLLAYHHLGIFGDAFVRYQTEISISEGWLMQQIQKYTSTDKLLTLIYARSMKNKLCV